MFQAINMRGIVQVNLTHVMHSRVNGHVGKYAGGFEGVHGGNGVGKRNAEGRRLLEFCDEKELCVANTRFKKTDKRKITSSAGGCGTEIDFVLVGEKYRKYIRDV